VLLNELSELQRVVRRVVVKDEEAHFGTVIIDELLHKFDE
jgi:hypothetical protein